jgi:hypothetical protein
MKPLKNGFAACQPFFTGDAELSISTKKGEVIDLPLIQD